MPRSEKSTHQPQKLKKNYDYSSLKDAFTEGELVCPIGTELILGRFRNGKEVLSVCTVKSIQENGLVHTWDETIQQWFIFSKLDPPKIAKIKE